MFIVGFLAYWALLSYLLCLFQQMSHWINVLYNIVAAYNVLMAEVRVIQIRCIASALTNMFNNCCIHLQYDNDDCFSDYDLPKKRIEIIDMLLSIQEMDVAELEQCFSAHLSLIVVLNVVFLSVGVFYYVYQTVYFGGVVDHNLLNSILYLIVYNLHNATVNY